MKKIVFGGLAVVAVILGVWSMSKQPELVVKHQAVLKQIGQVQNVIERQYQLLGNLAETVKGQAAAERDTFVQVADARSRAGGVINVDPSKIASDPALQKQMMDSANSLSGTIGRLLMVQEKYPELKQDKAWQDLRVELSGSINRITQERRRLQDTTNEYNVAVMQFPAVIPAKILGYNSMPYFQAAASHQDAPKLDMSLPKPVR